MKKNLCAFIMVLAMVSSFLGLSTFAAEPAHGYSDIQANTFFGVGATNTIFDLSSASGLTYTIKSPAAVDTAYESYSGNFSANLSQNHFLVIKLKKSDSKFQVYLLKDGVQLKLQDFAGETAVPTNLIFDLSLPAFSAFNIQNEVSECRLGLILGPNVWGSNIPVGSTIEITDMYLTDSASNLKPDTSTIGASRIENSEIHNVSEYDTLTFNNDNTFTLTNKPTVDTGDFTVNFGGIDITKTPYFYIDVKQTQGIVVDFMGETTLMSDSEYSRALLANTCMPGIIKFDLRSIYPNGIAANSKKYVRVFTTGLGKSNIYNGVYFGGPIFQIGPAITVGQYDGVTATAGPIIVTATTDKGTLNVGSHTFTSNGSFDFIATDSETGIITTKTVKITNIGTSSSSSGTNSNPKTGDTTPMMLIVLAVMAIAGLTFATKKMKTN